MQSLYNVPGELWNSVRQELAAFKAVLPLMVADWKLPWNNLVLCSDSSMNGFGCSHSFWSLEDVMAVGRVQERSRYRFEAGGARVHALDEAVGASGNYSSLELCRTPDDARVTRLSGCLETSDFPEVPV